MGFAVGGCEVCVTADGLIHLVGLVAASLGLDAPAAARELVAMGDAGGFPDVKCFKRAGDVLVTSGGAESVLVRLIQQGKGFTGAVVMTMRCFMSQNGPFVPRIREGTTPLSSKGVCAELAAGLGASDWFLDDLEWACPSTDQGIDKVAPDQTEMAREAQCEHYAAVVARYRALCVDTVMDERGAASFKTALRGMFTDTAAEAREAQREHFDRVAGWYVELCQDTVVDDQGKALFKEVLTGMLAVPGRAEAARHAREAWRRGIDERLG